MDSWMLSLRSPEDVVQHVRKEKAALLDKPVEDIPDEEFDERGYRIDHSEPETWEKGDQRHHEKWCPIHKFYQWNQQEKRQYCCGKLPSGDQCGKKLQEKVKDDVY